MDRRPAGEMEISHAKWLAFSLISAWTSVHAGGAFSGVTWHIHPLLGNAWRA
jgi:hypothetical protein